MRVVPLGTKPVMIAEVAVMTIPPIPRKQAVGLPSRVAIRESVGRFCVLRYFLMYNEKWYAHLTGTPGRRLLSDRAERGNTMNHHRMILPIIVLTGSAACSQLLPTPAPAPTATPDSIATGVAEGRAIASTLTAESRMIASTLTAEGRAIASTLTAEAAAPLPGKRGIYVTGGDNLYWMDLDGGGVEVVSAGLGISERLAVDYVHSKLYISRWSASAQIMVYDLQTGGAVQPFRDGPGDGGQGLAVDPDTSTIYLGLYYGGVYRMEMSQAGIWIQLVSPASLAPLLGQRGQLQIDPADRHIYFRTAFNSHCDLCRYIWRVDFDGNNLIKIIQANGGDALALDLTERKMYFSNVPGNYMVMRANLDGSGVETIFTIPAPYTFCRAIVLNAAQRKLYLSLYNESIGNRGRAIARLNLDGTGFEILYEATADTAEEVSGGIALFLPD